MFQSLNHVDINLKSCFLIKSGYHIVPSPSTALHFSMNLIPLWFFFSELSRAYLCSTVLVLDLLIVMQDWDFPHFTNTLDVNLPGFHKHIINIDTVEIQISGKWFNYGIIFLVMIFDLNMWKNQIFYYPEKYGQYIGELVFRLH